MDEPHTSAATLAAAESILATCAAARSRISWLSNHLSFSAAVAVHEASLLGHSPARDLLALGGATPGARIPVEEQDTTPPAALVDEVAEAEEAEAAEEADEAGAPEEVEQGAGAPEEAEPEEEAAAQEEPEEEAEEAPEEAPEEAAAQEEPEEAAAQEEPEEAAAEEAPEEAAAEADAGAAVGVPPDIRDTVVPPPPAHAEGDVGHAEDESVEDEPTSDEPALDLAASPLDETTGGDDDMSLAYAQDDDDDDDLDLVDDDLLHDADAAELSSDLLAALPADDEDAGAYAGEEDVADPDTNSRVRGLAAAVAAALGKSEPTRPPPGPDTLGARLARGLADPDKAGDPKTLPPQALEPVDDEDSVDPSSDEGVTVSPVAPAAVDDDVLGEPEPSLDGDLYGEDDSYDDDDEAYADDDDEAYADDDDEAYADDDEAEVHDEENTLVEAPLDDDGPALGSPRVAGASAVAVAGVSAGGQPAEDDLALGADDDEDDDDYEDAEDAEEAEEAEGGGFSVAFEEPEYEEDDEADEPEVDDGVPRLTDEADMAPLGAGITTTPDGIVAGAMPELNVAPEVVQGHLDKADAAEESGDLFGAIVHYGDLIDVDPDNSSAYLARGRALMEVGDYAAAMSDFQRGEDLAPESAEPLVEMGHLFFNRKEYVRAIEFYDQAIEIDPSHAMARARRGIAHHYRKDHRKAFQDLQRAYSLNPDIPNIRKYVQMAVKAMERGGGAGR